MRTIGQTLGEIIDARRPDTLAHLVPDEVTGDEPAHVRPQFRRMTRTRAAGVTLPPIEVVDIEEGRRMATQAIASYLAIPEPAHVLVLALPAGTGKSTIAVHLAEEIARTKQRYVGFATPRHDMHETLLAEATEPGLFWRFEPKRAGVDRDPEPTCKYPLAQAGLARRGFQPFDGCKTFRDCGIAYATNLCRYHRQEHDLKLRGARICVIQHQHLFLGCPLAHLFGVLIVDESPLGAVERVWRIPLPEIMPVMPATEAMYPILETLLALARTGQRIHGRPLMDQLGGPQVVLEACRDVDPDATHPVDVAYPEDVPNRGYWYVPTLAGLLTLEATAALLGHDYPARILVEDAPDEEGIPTPGLTLLKRHGVRWRSGSVTGQGFPDHVICLDATADQRVVEQIYRRPAVLVRPAVATNHRLFQVVDRANGIGSVVRRADGSRRDKASGTTLETWRAGDLAPQGAQLLQQVAHLSGLYRAEGKSVGIITHKKLLPHVEEMASRDDEGERLLANFFGQRGTNDFRDVDCLIVAGTPMPPPQALHVTARCLILDPDGGPRMTPFRVEGEEAWAASPRAYRHRDPADPEAVFMIDTPTYQDPDLAALADQMVDAELVQAVSRGRGVLRSDRAPLDVWLLSNRPVDGAPPTHLVTVRDLFRVPPGLTVWTWARLLEVEDAHHALGRALTTSDVVRQVGVDPRTAATYVNALATQYPDRWRDPAPGDRVLLPQGSRRGRPPAFVVPRTEIRP